jgi:lysozyme
MTEWTLGLDVSAAQGLVDWHAVKAGGASFVYIKCFEGNDGADPWHARNVAGARAANLIVGEYFVGLPLPASSTHPNRAPGDQAKLWRAASLWQPGDLPPAIDLEWPLPQNWAQYDITAASIRAWVVPNRDAVQDLWKVNPATYTFKDWDARVGLGQCPTLATSPLWLASYPFAGRYPKDGEHPNVAVTPWPGASFWQCTDSGRIAGIACPVDLDVYAGTEDDLRAFIGGLAA